MNRPTPMPEAAAGLLALANARIVLADRVIVGTVLVEDGIITEVAEGAAVPGGAVDCGGDFLLPGFVDVHTDHFEKHVLPRAHVPWDPISAALAHDSQIIGSGITTVFDSICVGTAGGDEVRRELLKPIIEAIRLCRAHGMFRAEHLVHLRCEVVDEMTPDLAAAVIDHEFVRLVSVMNHTPGQRQSRDVEAWAYRQMKAKGYTREAAMAEMAEIVTRAEGVSAKVEPAIIALAKARALPLMSHDDATVEQVAHAEREGITISEFPTTIEAARAAQAAGQKIVMGAPNYLRGGSQSGNVALRDLLEEKLVDILASDYVPRAMLDAAFRIADDTALPYDLPAAVRMVSLTPARVAGLDDRGEIAAGQKADLLRVRRAVAHPVITTIWRAGLRVG